MNDKGQRTKTNNDNDKEEEHRTLYQHPEQRLISETYNSFKTPKTNHITKNTNTRQSTNNKNKQHDQEQNKNTKGENTNK